MLDFAANFLLKVHPHWVDLQKAVRDIETILFGVLFRLFQLAEFGFQGRHQRGEVHLSLSPDTGQLPTINPAKRTDNRYVGLEVTGIIIIEPYYLPFEVIGIAFHDPYNRPALIFIQTHFLKNLTIQHHHLKLFPAEKL